MASDGRTSRSQLSGWRDGRVGFPSLVILLAGMAAGALGGASIGGAIGLTIIVAVLVGMVGLLIAWSSSS